MHLTRLALVSAVLAATLAPSRAHAADPPVVKDFGTVCLAGAIRTCASIQVKTTVVYQNGQPAYTQVSISVANMQGTDATDNTGGSLLTQIGVTAPDLNGASNLTVSGPVGAGTPSTYWSINNNPVGGQVELSAGVENLEGGIRGCDLAESGANKPQNYFLTCGNSGPVTLTFRTETIWSATDAQLAFGVRSVAVDGNSYQCRTADDEGEHACIPSTVPEPATIALLATGLLGVGAASRRRRERNRAAR